MLQNESVLLARIEKLEAMTGAGPKRNSALKTTLPLGCGFLVILSAVWFPRSSNIEPSNKAASFEAREFILVDAMGRKRAVLGTDKDPDSAVGLYIKDEEGVTRVLVTGSKDGGATVMVFGKTNKEMVSMGISAEGTAAFGINDKNGKTRAGLGVDDNHNSQGVYLADKEGRGRIALGIDARGQAALNVTDKNEGIRAAVGTDPDGNGKVSIRNNKGEKVFSVPQQPNQ